jgi:hypothetical protein
VLVDFVPPLRVRELAGRTNASAATLSRVIDLLVREGLAVRDDKGVVTDVDWVGAIRRWAQDYDVLRTNDGESFLQPRGLAALTGALRTTKLRYALTGSVAAKHSLRSPPPNSPWSTSTTPPTPPMSSICDPPTPARM